MGRTDDFLSYGTVLEGNKAETSVGLGDVDVCQLSVLTEVFLQFSCGNFWFQGEATDKHLAGNIGSTLRVCVCVCVCVVCVRVYV